MCIHTLVSIYIYVHMYMLYSKTAEGCRGSFCTRYWREVLAYVWQCVAVCCSVLQCVAVCCSVLQCVAVCHSVLQCVAVCCSVLQCVAVRCSVLLCVAVCCSVMRCVTEQLLISLLARSIVICECIQTCGA